MALTDVKKGETVIKLMSRYNPQLGTYYVFSKEVVEKVTSKSIITSYQKFNKQTGDKIGEDGSVYGSADYTIMTMEDAIAKNRSLIDAGCRVRGLENINA